MTSEGNARPLAVLMSTAAFWFALGQTTSAHATPIQYQYTGTLETADPSTGYFHGDTISGTFTYDPEAFPGDFLGGTATYSRPFDPPYSGRPGLTFKINGQNVMNSPFLNVSTITEPWPTPDSKPRVTFMGVGPSVKDGSSLRTEIELLEPSGVDFGIYGPTSPLSLANFTDSILHVTWSHDNTTQVMYSGRLTSLTATTIPEPAATSLVCLVAAGWLARTRRRRSQSR